jgi:hypothetical protein
LRLTEALCYYNAEIAPSEAWMRLHFTHFSPTTADTKAREAYRKRLQAKSLGRKRKKTMEVYE